MRITLVIGLPASGKTTFAPSLGADVLVDDPTTLTEVVGQTFDHMVIAHYAFCDPETLTKAKAILHAAYPGVEIDEVFFANDPEQCLANACLRPAMKVDDMIRRMSQCYDPPRIDHDVWHPRH